MSNKKQPLRSIMFVGTGSDVGKSIINAGFCRIFKQDGYTPAPFKAQNMSLNSYPTPEGLEIGRAQAVQAEACSIVCSHLMNPVLLKPIGNCTSQVIVNGKAVGNRSAKEYFSNGPEGTNALWEAVTEAFSTLHSQYNPIVLEGAGSISELNLRDRDIVNMRMALHANAATFLVADIDRGGVFASVVGSLQLLPENERKLIKGVIINKFRGDIDLFKEGKKQLEAITKIPVVGIVPYYSDIYIDEEDSVTLSNKTKQTQNDKVQIAVVLLNKLSNFTDFNVLERDERCNLFYSANPQEITEADIIIIPGSKNTIEDLQALRKTGMAQAILQTHKNGKTVIGICGGYQIMGQLVSDTFHIESDIEHMPGLGLLPIKTILEPEKITHQRHFKFLNNTNDCIGYEIHQGRSIVTENNKESALCALDNQQKDGYFLNEKCWGTYLHGILDNPTVVDSLIAPYHQSNSAQNTDIQSFKEKQYNALADHLRQHCDIDLIYSILKD